MADFGDVVELTRDQRDALFHAARRRMRISSVPLTRNEVADLFEAGCVGIPIQSNAEDDWFFTNTGLKTAAALGFFGGDVPPQHKAD